VKKAAQSRIEVTSEIIASRSGFTSMISERDPPLPYRLECFSPAGLRTTPEGPTS
jgi:hypothetical protein